MQLIGNDFRRAKSQWLYPVEPQQWFWRGLGLFLLIAVVDGFAQVLGGALAYALIYGRGPMQFFGDASLGVPEALKASIVGIGPTAILVILCAIYLMRFGMAKRRGSLPLQFPALGALGWFLLIAGFLIVMIAVFQSTFAILGIDPETYSPSGGLKGSGPAGMVEKIMADLSHEPWLFALALPGAFIAAPVTEEFIFRGFLFSAIATSRLGKGAAVVISSALWALVHLAGAPWLFVGIIFIMGLLLGVLLLRFGSLWVTIILHAVWNLLTAASIFGIGTHS